MNQDTALDILKTGRNSFLTGAAGTGKTYVLNKYIKWLKEQSIPVAVTASTGIAATHLSGQTIHSWSGVGIKDVISDWDLDALSQKEQLVKRLNNTEVLIIDEISMLHASTLDNINLILQTIRNSYEPFGGMQVVFSGDFFQLPPIVKYNDEHSMDTESIFAFSSSAWAQSNPKILYLTEQYRQKDELIDILNALRERNLNEDLLGLLRNRLSHQAAEGVVHLHTHNANVDKINESKLKELSGSLYEHPMTLTGNKARAENLARNILAPELLRLKKGARVMFVKNDPQGNFVNGSLGTVTRFSYGLPEVELDNGKKILAEPAEWRIENESGKAIASATQIPIRLAWAITVHKSQGMSMDAARMDLSKSFVPGQGYVALSRVRSLSGLYIDGLNDAALQVNDLVFEKDQSFQSSSLTLDKIFNNYSDKKKSDLISEFVSARRKENPSKIATHAQSLALLQAGKSIKQIAKLRDLKVSTIINHLEKAQDEGEQFDISKELKGIELKEIFTQFKHKGFAKLSPIHKALKAKYDFETLRLARIQYIFSLQQPK